METNKTRKPEEAAADAMKVEDPVTKMLGFCR
jgi:hypothetical protein